jgi:hypothetical protein
VLVVVMALMAVKTVQKAMAAHIPPESAPKCRAEEMQSEKAARVK